MEVKPSVLLDLVFCLLWVDGYILRLIHEQSGSIVKHFPKPNNLWQLHERKCVDSRQTLIDQVLVCILLNQNLLEYQLKNHLGK